MSNWVEGMIIWANARNQRVRTVVPGVVDKISSTGDREQFADLNPGIADLIGGEAAPTAITEGAPMMNLASGGFFMLMPINPGDETLGLVVDRASGEWVESRTPGQADQVNGERSKVLSDVVLTPWSITAPEGAPTTWDRLTLGGPSGVALEVTTGGEVTLTKQGAPVATISMEASGSVTIDVESGQSVNLGGAAAAALAKYQDLITAVDAAITAAITAAAPLVPPNGGDGGTAAFTAFQTAWDGLKANITTQKAKGE